MKMRKWLSVVLSAALLLSCVAATGVMAVSAETTVWDIQGTTNVDKIIAPEDNILATATGSAIRTTWSDAAKDYVENTVTPDAVLYDGNLCGVNGVADGAGIWSVAHKKTYEIWVTYTLDGIYDVDSLLLAGSGYNPLGDG